MRERLILYLHHTLYHRITPARAGKTVNSNPHSGHLHGSPPLVRERLEFIADIGRLDGITPARAGKTYLYNIILKRNWDHPRSCGKDTNWTNGKYRLLGSPPLVRERLDCRLGNTYNRRDHPRSCGKDFINQTEMGQLPGSPPLVRERPFQGVPPEMSVGITPARAGKTTSHFFHIF